MPKMDNAVTCGNAEWITTHNARYRVPPISPMRSVAVPDENGSQQQASSRYKARYNEPVLTSPYPLPPGTTLIGDQLTRVARDIADMYDAGMTLRAIAERTGLSLGKVQALRSLSGRPARRFAWQEIR